MRYRSLLALVLYVALVFHPLPAQADPEHVGDAHGDGVVTDDPNHAEDGLLGFEGSGITSVESYLGNQPAATQVQRKARHISLVGALKGDPT